MSRYAGYNGTKLLDIKVQEGRLYTLTREFRIDTFCEPPEETIVNYPHLPLTVLKWRTSCFLK